MHIHKLQQLVDSSVSTLRRDLIELETNGIIKRSFGLVTLLRKDNIEYTASFRSTQHPNEKRKICRLASDLIFDNDSVFIDSSTTNKYIIQNLTDREKVNVITNNIYIAMQGHNQKIFVFF
ncbi:DeoR family transcriptional regulator [Ligilactobacillus salivarius]